MSHFESIHILFPPSSRWHRQLPLYSRRRMSREKNADILLPLFTQRTCIAQNWLFTHPAITEKSRSCVTIQMQIQYLLSFRSTSLLQRFWDFTCCSSHNAQEPAAAFACSVQVTGSVFFQSFFLLAKDIRAEKWVWTVKWGDTHYETDENWRGPQIQVTTGCVRPICKVCWNTASTTSGAVASFNIIQKKKRDIFDAFIFRFIIKMASRKFCGWTGDALDLPVSQSQQIQLKRKRDKQ